MMHLHCGGAVRRLPRAQFMYSRLHKMKLLAQEGDESARLRRINAVARGLSLHTRPIGTRDVRANAMRSVRGVRQVLTCARLGVTACRVCVCVCAYGRRIVEHAHSNGNYGYLLDLIDRFLDSKVDQQKFEDCTREMFGTAAYPLFTIDKLVHTLVRQVHAVVIDEPSERLIDMMYQHANPAAAAAAAAAAATAAAAVAVTAVAAPATATSAAASNTGAAPAEPAALEPPSYREQVNAIIPADDNCYRLDYVRARPRHARAHTSYMSLTPMSHAHAHVARTRACRARVQGCHDVDGHGLDRCRQHVRAHHDQHGPNRVPAGRNARVPATAHQQLSPHGVLPQRVVVLVRRYVRAAASAPYAPMQTLTRARTACMHAPYGRPGTNLVLVQTGGDLCPAYDNKARTVIFTFTCNPAQVRRGGAPRARARGGWLAPLMLCVHDG